MFHSTILPKNKPRGWNRVRTITKQKNSKKISKVVVAISNKR